MPPNDARAKNFGSLKKPNEMARPKRFELLTPKFVVWCSIQLSYGRMPRAVAARRGIATALFVPLQGLVAAEFRNTGSYLSAGRNIPLFRLASKRSNLDQFSDGFVGLRLLAMTRSATAAAPPCNRPRA